LDFAATGEWESPGRSDRDARSATGTLRRFGIIGRSCFPMASGKRHDRE
jgi:hypothetical protein